MWATSASRNGALHAVFVCEVVGALHAVILYPGPNRFIHTLLLRTDAAFYPWFSGLPSSSGPSSRSRFVMILTVAPSHGQPSVRTLTVAVGPRNHSMCILELVVSKIIRWPAAPPEQCILPGWKRHFCVSVIVLRANLSSKLHMNQIASPKLSILEVVLASFQASWRKPPEIASLVHTHHDLYSDSMRMCAFVAPDTRNVGPKWLEIHTCSG